LDFATKKVAQAARNFLSYIFQ